MSYVSAALLLVLLAASAARATVYAWNDADGALVLTNDADAVPSDPQHPVTTYGTTVAPDAEAGGAVEARSTSSGAAATHDAGAPGVAAPEGTAPKPSGTTPVAATAAASGSTRTLGATGGQAQASAAPGAEAPGNEGGSIVQRQAIDPRALLLERSAQQEPPRVIVSIVSPSARPLSGPGGETRLSSDASRGRDGSALGAASRRLDAAGAGLNSGLSRALGSQR
jgi:hypothetical protein